MDDVVAHVPPPALADAVVRCDGWCFPTEAGARHHGRPQPVATVIVNLDHPLRVQWPGERDERFQVLAAGLHTRHSIVHADGRQHGIQLGLTPVGVRDLLGVPISVLGGVMAEIDDAVAPSHRAAWAHLAERLAAARSWPERFELLDAALVRARAAATVRAVARAEAAEVWTLIHERRGAVTMADLGARTGWSPRHLRSVFRTEFGVTIKQAARIVRLERAWDLAADHGLAVAAARAGYADQAHLTRDCRALVGRTPSDALAEPYFVPDSSRPDDMRSSTMVA